MNSPVEYITSRKNTFNDIYPELMNSIEWIRRDRTPRQEAFYSFVDTSYTYGSGAGIRTYMPIISIPDSLRNVWTQVENVCGTWFEFCFLNRYDSQHEHLGWHADDSDSIDQTRPIAVLSLGAERDIWFRANGSSDVDKLRLESGSILIMQPGIQGTHQHRIPKHDRPCETRISLTFRGAA